MGRSQPATRLIAAILTASALVVSASVHGLASATGSDASPQSAGELVWTPCEGGECASLEVPLDYRKPKGRQIEVELFRLPARQPEQKIGSLLTNPGGPGASGVESLRSIGAAYPAEFLDRFDLIGFDPRGTGGTIPIDCTDTLDPLLDHEFSPATAKERQALTKAAKRFAQQCQKQHGKNLARIASVDTVRDMDRIRAVLGDEGLSYIGQSYGSYLGALYAELYPENVRAMVLDGPIDPALSALEFQKEQAVGFERGLTAFFESCAADPTCPFHSNGDPTSAYDDLLAQLEEQPLHTPDGRVFGPSVFTNGVVSSLYGGEQAYPELASALAAVANGDTAPLLNESDSYYEREQDGTYSNLQEAYYAISCVDRPPIPARQRRSLEAEFVKASPHFGLDLLHELIMCSYWPANPAKAPTVTGKGAAPIAIFSATGDPVTPVEAGEGLARALQSSVLVEVDATRHVSIYSNQCVRDIASRYLVDLEVPPAGTTCGP